MVGDRIKYLRKQSGLTQTQFAEKLNEKYNLNIERSMVSKWEIGMQSPMIYTVSCIANFFGVSIDYLTGKEEKPPETDGKAKELLDIINQLSDQNLDRAIDYLTILLQTQ